MMHAPDRKAEIDINAPLGTYAVDVFLNRFTKTGLKLETATPNVDAIISTYRRDVVRVARLALVRTRHDKDRAAQAGDADEFLTAILELKPGLERALAPLDAQNVAVSAAHLSRGLRNTGGERVVAADVVHTIEAARDLLNWINHVGDFEIDRPPSRNVPMPRHVATLAVEMYYRRLGKPPAANRGAWLADFLIALWRDYGWPAGFDEDEELRLYLGRKIEDAVARLKGAPAVSPV
jgi:hypothetical protein